MPMGHAHQQGFAATEARRAQAWAKSVSGSQHANSGIHPSIHYTDKHNELPVFGLMWLAFRWPPCTIVLERYIHLVYGTSCAIFFVGPQPGTYHHDRETLKVVLGRTHPCRVQGVGLGAVLGR